MRDIPCSECGEVPRLAKLNGDVIIRCECETVLAIDDSENPRYVPETWQASLARE